MKHERAAIMALTFCIGFTTALIAYGIPVADEPVITYTPTNRDQAANVLATQQTNTASRADFPVTQIALDETGLSLLTPTATYLVSVPFSNAPTIAEAHTQIHEPLLSPDENYLFYCTQTPDMVDGCFPRIFSVIENTVYPLQGSVPRLVQLTDMISVAWSSSGQLLFGEWASVSPQTPWIMQ